MKNFAFVWVAVLSLGMTQVSFSKDIRHDSLAKVSQLFVTQAALDEILQDVKHGKLHNSYVERFMVSDVYDDVENKQFKIRLLQAPNELGSGWSVRFIYSYKGKLIKKEIPDAPELPIVTPREFNHAKISLLGLHKIKELIKSGFLEEEFETALESVLVKDSREFLADNSIIDFFIITVNLKNGYTGKMKLVFNVEGVFIKASLKK